MDRVDREDRRAERVLWCLASISDMSDGGEISEFEHAVQTATHAERTGVDDELLAAGEMPAELQKPHLRTDLVFVVRHHGAFTARHLDPSLTGESGPKREYRNEPWYGLAETFVDEWDMEHFDPQWC